MSWSVCVCEANCTSVCTMSRFLIKRKIQTRHSIQFIVPHKSQTRAQNTLLRSSIWEGIFRNYLILRQSAAFINCKIKISSVVHRCVDISLKQTHFSDEIKRNAHQQTPTQNLTILHILQKSILLRMYKKHPPLQEKLQKNIHFIKFGRSSALSICIMLYIVEKGWKFFYAAIFLREA